MRLPCVGAACFRRPRRPCASPFKVEMLYGLLTLFESLNDESKNDKGKENDIQLVISSCYAPEAF